MSTVYSSVVYMIITILLEFFQFHFCCFSEFRSDSDLQGFGNLAGLPDPPALQVFYVSCWLPNLQGLPDLVGFVPLSSVSCFFGFLYLDLRGFGNLAGLGSSNSFFQF